MLPLTESVIIDRMTDANFPITSLLSGNSEKFRHCVLWNMWNNTTIFGKNSANATEADWWLAYDMACENAYMWSSFS